LINEYFVVYCNVALTINGNVREKQFESKRNLEQGILYHSGRVCFSACCYFILEFFLTTISRKNIAEALFRTGNTRQMRITAGLYFQHRR